MWWSSFIVCTQTHKQTNKQHLFSLTIVETFESYTISIKAWPYLLFHTFLWMIAIVWLFGFISVLFGLCVPWTVRAWVWVHIKFENMRPEHTSHVIYTLFQRVVNLKYKWKLNKNHSLLQSDREKSRERVNKCVKGLFELMAENNQPEVEKRTTSTLFVSLSTGLSVSPSFSLSHMMMLFEKDRHRKGKEEKKLLNHFSFKYWTVLYVCYVFVLCTKW